MNLGDKIFSAFSLTI